MSVSRLYLEFFLSLICLLSDSSILHVPVSTAQSWYTAVINVLEYFMEFTGTQSVRPLLYKCMYFCECMECDFMIFI